MKKILLSFLSLACLGLTNLATAADEVLAWNQVYNGYYVKTGCSWQAGGATPYGPVQNLVCFNWGAVAERVPNAGAPESVNAIGSGYYVTAKGGDGIPNGYNYVVYKRTTPPACTTPNKFVKSYTTLGAATSYANMANDLKQCGQNCIINTVAANPGYENRCR